MKAYIKKSVIIISCVSFLFRIIKTSIILFITLVAVPEPCYFRIQNHFFFIFTYKQKQLKYEQIHDTEYRY